MGLSDFTYNFYTKVDKKLLTFLFCNWSTENMLEIMESYVAELVVTPHLQESRAESHNGIMFPKADD